MRWAECPGKRVGEWERLWGLIWVIMLMRKGQIQNRFHFRIKNTIIQMVLERPWRAWGSGIGQTSTINRVWGNCAWSRALLTCVYSPYDLQKILQRFSCDTPTLFPHLPGHLLTSKPARTQTVSIQLSTLELVTVYTHLPLLFSISHLQSLNKPACWLLNSVCLACVVTQGFCGYTTSTLTIIPQIFSQN